MKVKCIIDMDLESNDYEVSFTSGNKEGIDYYEVKKFLQHVLADWSKQIEDSGIDSDDNVTKAIH